MLKTVLSIAIVLAFAALLWLYRQVFSAASLMIAALSAALRRARLTGAMPWHHNHSVRAQIALAQASPDAFDRLTREAMLYANWPGVTVMYHVAAWPEDPMLVRTTADPYGKRAYVETLRLIGDKVVHLVCLHLDGAQTPVEVGTLECPAEQTNVYVLRARIEDIVREGVFLSVRDHAGRVRETRLPKEVMHHA